MTLCSRGSGQADAGAGRSSATYEGGDRGPYERNSDLSVRIARLKRLMRTRSNDSSPGPVSVDERPSEAPCTEHLHGRPQESSGLGAGVFKPQGPRVLQQSPSAADAQSGLRKLRGRRTAMTENGATRARACMEAAGSLDDKPAVARSANVDFEAMVEQKMREEETSAAGDAEGRQPCHTCGRRFAEAVLEKHQAVCAKAAASARAPMDMRQKRLADVVQGGSSAPCRRGRPGRNSGRPGRVAAQGRAVPDKPIVTACSQAKAWKRKSDAFRAAMRASRYVWSQNRTKCVLLIRFVRSRAYSRHQVQPLTKWQLPKLR